MWNLKQALMNKVISQLAADILLVLWELLQQSSQYMHLALQEIVSVCRGLLDSLPLNDVRCQLPNQQYCLVL